MKNLAILLVLVIAAIAAPATTHLAVRAYAQHREASMHFADLKRQRRELEEYGEEVAEYGRFATRVETFIGNARVAGISEEGWNRHHVDVQNREATFAELAEFVADASSGDDFYFLPSSLRIQTGFSSGAGKLFGRGNYGTSNDGVRVSLVGDYLVPVQ